MADRFTPLDATMPSRLLPSTEADVRILTWNLDWACPRCRRFGNVPVKVTGGPRSPTTGGLTPKTSDEEIDRLFRAAHTDGNLCIYKELLLGEMWRWERQQSGPPRMVILQRRGKPLAEYRWPPWNG